MKTILPFVADPHCGSTTGLITPKVWQLDAGGTYSPSRAQRIIWRQWAECWDTIADLRKPGDRVVITSMGDAVDGVHNETTELVTHRKEEQERIYIDCIDWAMKLIDFSGDDLLQFISGTPVHVGEMAQSERRISADLKAGGVYNRLKFAIHGVKFDVAHKRFGIGRRAWTGKNPMRAKLISMLYSLLRNKDNVPDYIIGAHWHKYLNEQIEEGLYTTRGVICPSLQAKTTYGKLVTNDDFDPPDIGMFIVIVDESGDHECLCPRMKYPKERYKKI